MNIFQYREIDLNDNEIRQTNRFYFCGFVNEKEAEELFDDIQREISKGYPGNGG